jgi:acyl carrier protein phosphodiesterase
MAMLFENKLYWFKSQCQHIIFFFLNVFYTHKHTNSAVTQPLFNYMVYVSKVIFAPLARLEMRVMQIFLLFFHNSFFFVYRNFDLEGLCSGGTKTRHVNLACGP